MAGGIVSPMLLCTYRPVVRPLTVHAATKVFDHLYKKIRIGLSPNTALCISAGEYTSSLGLTLDSKDTMPDHLIDMPITPPVPSPYATRTP